MSNAISSTPQPSSGNSRARLRPLASVYPKCPDCGHRLRPVYARPDNPKAYVRLWECTNPKCRVITVKRPTPRGIGDIVRATII